ncbi:MAG TPA: ankyrin repeat domain-containing protein [Pyrinomonadaceae bacterium]
MRIRNQFDSQLRRYRPARFRIVFILLILLGSIDFATAQTGVDYRFLEVLDTAGNPVADANVETNSSREKTDGKGSVKLPIYYGDFHTTSLKISKADFYSYEDPAPPFSYRTEYLLRGEIPQFDFRAPLKIELLKIPISAAERIAVERKQRARELILAAKQGDAARVQKLLQAGADAEARDINGITAMLWAVFGGNAEAINALLATGARAGPNALRYYLFYAGRIDRDVVRSLLREVPNIDAADSLGRTVLILAAASLASHSAEAIEILLQNRIAIDAKDNEGRTALMAAIGTSESVEKTRLLLAMRPDLNATDNHTRTAVILAAGNGYTDILKMLLDAGADINKQDDEGQTALIASLGRGFIGDPDRTAATVKLLLAAGADVNIQDREGQTALGLARKSGNEKLIKILEGIPE